MAYHFPKGKVICRIRERVNSPFLQHASWNHVCLHLLQHISQHLMAHLRPSRLDCCQSLVVTVDWSVIFYLPFGGALQAEFKENLQ